MDEAVANAAAALRQHVEAVESAGRHVPHARGIDDVLTDEDVAASVEAGAVLFAVPLLADAGRTVRINISLDNALVKGTTYKYLDINFNNSYDNMVDIIVAGATPAGLAAQQATKTTPIVVTAMGDPVRDGEARQTAANG
jgi:hypothetical protein